MFYNICFLRNALRKPLHYFAENEHLYNGIVITIFVLE